MSGQRDVSVMLRSLDFLSCEFGNLEMLQAVSYMVSCVFKRSLSCSCNMEDKFERNKPQSKETTCM